MRLLSLPTFTALGSLLALPAASPQTPQVAVVRGPNYTQHVAPLLKARCVNCHREGGPAPFSLDTYAQAKRWSTMNCQVVGNRRMPPWKPVDKGLFHDENRLTDDEIKVLKAWNEAGGPKGPEVATVALAEVSAAPIEAPDKVLQPARPYVVMAGHEDEYRYFVVRNPYAETKWLRGVDLKPGNSRVVHHMTAFLDRTDTAERLERANKDGQLGYPAKDGSKFTPSGILGFWAPGMQNRAMPEDTAMALPAGARIVVQVHYVSTGKSETDRWSLGLKLADAAPKRPMDTGLIERRQIEIPAGDHAYKAIEEETVPADMTMWALMPHAHGIARRMTADAILPDGSQKHLIEISDWDPAWQSMYWFKEAIHLPKGARVRFTVVYDNSDANPRNPHQPPRAIHRGEDSKDEMMMLAFLFTRD